jgi:amidase
MLDSSAVAELDGLLVPNGHSEGRGDGCASVTSFAGYPVPALPVGVNGLATPFGLCVNGRQWGEAKLLRVASAMEDLLGWLQSL